MSVFCCGVRAIGAVWTAALVGAGQALKKCSLTLV